jgi:hypothetical protein
MAKIFYKHINRAIDELEFGYIVTLQGRLDKTPIRIEIQVNTNTGEIP